MAHACGHSKESAAAMCGIKYFPHFSYTFLSFSAVYISKTNADTKPGFCIKKMSHLVYFSLVVNISDFNNKF